MGKCWERSPSPSICRNNDSEGFPSESSRVHRLLYDVTRKMDDADRAGE